MLPVLCNRVCIIMLKTCRSRVWRGNFQVGQAIDALLVGPMICDVEKQKRCNTLLLVVTLLQQGSQGA